jgi:phasin family protein
MVATTQDLSRFFPAFDKVVAFHKANFDALVQANTVLVKGVQEISKEFFAQAQDQMQSVATSSHAVFQAKNLTDITQLNAARAKVGYEKLLATSTKLGEMGVKVATDALAPMTARMNVAVETFTKPTA